MEAEDTFTPRPYQQRVARHLMGGENVIVQTPTGSGKTWTALQPFLVNLLRPAESEQIMPRTCRYAVPLRTLANQFHAEYRRILHDLDQDSLGKVVQGYSTYKILPVSVQTGEHPGDPRFESAMTFCTIDQLMAAYLGIPYGVSRRDTNIKVAGVAGSYLVLDEWHLFPLHVVDSRTNQWELKGARATSLAMLRMLQEQGMTRFTLMTATLSTSLVHRLGKMIGARVENLRQGARQGEGEEKAFERELAQITGNRSRTWQKVPRVLLECADDVLEQHAADRWRFGGATTLVVCNTVERAQQIYLRLWERSRSHGGIRPDLLLHARFTAERRTAQGSWVEDHLGARAWQGDNPNVIVVATQVVEVGLNISVQRLHTELAPANSLIQRAGRCARFAGQHGAVLVYKVPERRGWSLPYPEALCDCTWVALPGEPACLDFAREQDLIDAVHTKEDEAFLDRFDAEWLTIRGQILAGWKDSEKLGASRNLIRDVQQVQVIIHDDPKSISSEPWRYQAFGMHPSTLRSRFARLQELRDEHGAEYVLKRAILVEQEKQDDEQDSRTPLRCGWDEMGKAEVNGPCLVAAPMLAMPSALIHYSDDLGFAFRDYERLPELREFEKDMARRTSEQLALHAGRSHQSFTIQIGSYQHHIAGLLKAYQMVLSDEMRWPARALEDCLGYPHGTLDRAMRVLLAYHDVGKLTVAWQAWAHSWQDLVAKKYPDRYSPAPPDVLLAKTDFDPREHRELQKTVRPSRPRHAVESMALSKRIVLEAASQLAIREAENGYLLTKAMRMAIARHHSVDALGHGEARPHPAAAAIIQDAMRHTGTDEPWSQAIQGMPLEHQIAKMDNVGGLMTDIEQEANEAGIYLYFLLVRVLRLADQRAEMSYLAGYPRIGSPGR